MSQVINRIVSPRFFKSLPVLIFFIFFLGLFLYFIIPKYDFITDGLPAYLRFKNIFQRVGFVVHIFAGIIVYTAGTLQFIPVIRNSFPRFHRSIGKIYNVASAFCVAGLYLIATLIPVIGLSVSQILNGTLWIIFVILAYRFIRQGNVVSHRHCMTSSFICASYFVSIRLVDRFCMPFFRSLTDNEELALTISDFSVFVIPLSIVWFFWGISHYRKSS